MGEPAGIADIDRLIVGFCAASLACSAGDVDIDRSFDELGLDSHHLAEIVFQLEEELKFELQPSDIDRLSDARSLAHLSAIVSDALSERARDA